MRKKHLSTPSSFFFSDNTLVSPDGEVSTYLITVTEVGKR